MSSQLVLTWEDRVMEREVELNLVKGEITQFEKNIAQMKSGKGKAGKAGTLKAEISALEAKSEALRHTLAAEDEAAQQTEAKISALDKDRDANMAEYAQLQSLVREAQSKQKKLENREDLNTTLETESAAWHQEVKTLRQELNVQEQRVMSQRNEYNTRVEELEAQLKHERNELDYERRMREERGTAVPTTGSRAVSVASSNVSSNVSTLGRKNRKRDALGNVTNQQ